MNKFRLLLLILLLAAIPIAGFCYTDEQIVKFDGLYYRVLSAKDHTLAFLGTDNDKTGELVIPGHIFDGVDVTFTVISTGYHALYYCRNITSVKLPETMKSIEGYSFLNAKLKTMNIPAGLETVDDVAWGDVGSIPKFVVDKNNSHFEADKDGALYTKGRGTLCGVPSEVHLKSGVYTVDKHVRSINRAVFRHVTGLKKIVFPKDLQYISRGYPTIAPTYTITEFAIASGGSTPFRVIGGVLFEGTELVLYPRGKRDAKYKVPDGIKSIRTYGLSNSEYIKSIDLNEVITLNYSCIYSATELLSITLPKGIEPHNVSTKVGLTEGCFEHCPKLTEYKVQAGNKYFIAPDGILFSTDKTILYFYPSSKSGTTYTIPSSVTKIAGRAFQSAQKLTAVHIPANVESIGPEAFRTLPNLETVTFAKNSKLTNISYYAFRSCNKLTKVTLPRKLKFINQIFYTCKNLEVINIEANSELESIAANSFSTNTKLREFNFLGECSLQKIEGNVFSNLKALESFSIPKSVTVIEANAFSGCTNLHTVKFHPNAVIEKIGEGAFANCGITSIDIPKNVKEIHREAFLKCKALTKINVTKATTNISPEAFKSCDKLTEINVDKDNAVYSSIDGYLLSKDKETLKIFPTGKANDHFTLLPPSITIIGEYAFYDCKKLKNVTIPNKVDSIGKRAFGLCDNLNTITFLCDHMILPKRISNGLNNDAFDPDNGSGKRMGKIRINVRKEQYDTYKNNAFYKKFASIEKSFVQGQDEYIFVSDKAVDLLSTKRVQNTIVLPTKIREGAKSYEVSAIGDYAFQNASGNVKEVVVSNNVKYIGAQAFVTDIANNKSTIKHVFFIESQPTNQMLSTTRFELDATGKNYNEFAPDTKIYVKKSACGAYKTAWTKKIYDKVTGKEKPSPFNFVNQIDYRITDMKITSKYATFAREFDTDFNDYYKTFGTSNVAAFVAGKKIEAGAGDFGSSTQHIRMTSIDVNGGASNAYGYIPANTGVLLKLLNNKATTATDFYYTIGEKDDVSYSIANNVMVGVTENWQAVEGTSSSPVYVMQGGVFKKVTTTIPAGTFPLHRAYLKLKGGAGEAKLVLHFDDDDTTTDIDSVTTEGESPDNDIYYNLNGQRVSNPQKGVYILRGKKVIVK